MLKDQDAIIHAHQSVTLAEGDVLEVLIDHPANVQLLDDENYESYRTGKPYRYYGGYATASPVELPVPAAGKWHVTVDLGGGPGRVRSALRVTTAAATNAQLQTA